MAGGKKRKKKNAGAAGATSTSSKQLRPVFALSNVEQEEEMIALSAIYGADLELHEDGTGFNLKVVPHPGELEANFVSLQLQVRYPHSYPAQAVALKVKKPEGLAPASIKELLDQLNQSAAEHAQGGEVCVFDLVDVTQEFLRKYNVQQPEAAPEEVSASQAHGQSLWHAMQTRDAEQAERQPSLAATDSLANAASIADDMTSVGLVGGLSGDIWALDGGLFAFEAEEEDDGLFASSEVAPPPGAPGAMPSMLSASSASGSAAIAAAGLTGSLPAAAQAAACVAGAGAQARGPGPRREATTTTAAAAA